MALTRMVAASGWRYAAHGTPSRVLRFEKYRVPFDRRSSQVVVKMLAAPIHRHDKNMIEGNYGSIRPLSYPAVGGLEGCGIVEEVGADVRLGIKEGDLVWINNQRVGTWASHVVTDAENVDVMPNRADVDVEYVASMSTLHTARHLLEDYVKIQPGDVVLQCGASSAIAQVCMAGVRARGGKLFLAMQNGRAEHQLVVAKAKNTGAYALVPYSYARSSYMRRLLSDIPPPKLFLNHVHGHHASNFVKLLGDGGTCVTYGNMSSMPVQISNTDLIHRNLQFKHFFLPRWLETHTREQRMRVHQQCLDELSVSQGHGHYRGQRFKYESDALFAFSNAWDAPLTFRKSFLRMVGEYGEWRRPRFEEAYYQIARSLWDDIIEQYVEHTTLSDTPQSMKYYTPFGEFCKDFFDAKQAKEMGHRDLFLRRPHLSKHNAGEAPAPPKDPKVASAGERK